MSNVPNYHYTLNCPGCGYPMPTSLWFTSADHHDDEHGYVCCSTYITDFTKWSGIPIAKWIRMHTPSEWMQYPESTWKYSLNRSFRLKNDVMSAKNTKGSKGPVARKRKRTPKSPKSDQVLVDRDAVSQVVAAFSHTDTFLDNLMAVARQQPQNVLGPPVPQNVLGPFVPPVPQNVLGPFVPPVPQNVLDPKPPTRLNEADSQRLAQALAKVDKLEQWISTALKEVHHVGKVMHSILER